MLSRGNVPRQAIQYFASLAAVAVALVVRNELSRTIGSALPPFIFFYPAVMLVSLLAGLGPGLLTGATSAAATFTWIYPAHGRFSALAPGETLSLAIFLAVCVLMAAVAALYRQAKGRAAAYVVSLSRRESEARFSTVFHSSPMMMTISEVERGTLVDVNASFLEHCGLAREQVLGRKPRELGFQALEQGQVELMRELGQAASWESSLQTPSGGMETVLVSAQVIEVEGRKCLWTVIQDITEKKEAERELREREERYRGTLESMLVGCQTIGRDWTYLYVNSMAASHGRSTPDSLIGRRMTEVYPGIESTEMFAALRKCMEERVPVRTENEFRFPDGTSTWFDLSFQPVPEGVFILSYDISERKRSEEALRLSEEKFAQAFSGNPAAIALTRLGNGRFLEVNDRWVEL
ncbi:MAG TPA: PAS domain S-box protein, partial [Spirochaetia bacterium]|nr:PAS domain S-box protein [Spirochaetia bacterium]